MDNRGYMTEKPTLMAAKPAKTDCRAERMERLLQKELNPSRITLTDDSTRHAGHAGARPEGETHYTLVIEAECFRGLSRVQCHQLIYRLLGEEFKCGLHALAINASAPAQDR